MMQSLCILHFLISITALSSQIISVFDDKHLDFVDEVTFIEELQKEYDVKSESKGTKTPVHISQATLEVLVVVDRYVVNFHGYDSIENYVLTMMKMVSDIYSDASLGVSIKIIVSRILILHTDPYNFTTFHNGDKTLHSFCQWQFNQEITSKDVNLHDVAVLLTRKDICANSDKPCGTIGFAYNEGACTTNRKCVLIEDTGLNAAYTIAHELGHSLGMTHDNFENNCMISSAGHPHIMASQWSVPIQLPFKWSSCSKKQLMEFLSTYKFSSYKSYCLWKQSSFSAKFQKNLELLPGQIYDPDTQCKQHYGALAEHCTHFKKTALKTYLCDQLWCETKEGLECVSKGDPAAPGTKCDTGKFCMYGHCVNATTSTSDILDGGWGSITNWSVCSRSCGIGITYAERLCNNPIPKNGGRYCIGSNRKYKTCNKQPCPETSVPFRFSQCLQFSNNSMVPIYNETQPCALYCQPINKSSNIPIKFQSKVIDGTPCHQDFMKQYIQDDKEMKGICVDGQCQKLGCDKQLNSKLEMDACGICGGVGDACTLVEGEFTQPLGRGSVDAIDIPQGAMNLLVWEVKPCTSFLALKSEHGAFSINNNGIIELPGRYSFNGTIIYYLRKATQEFFYTVGPTQAKIKIMFSPDFKIKNRDIFDYLCREKDEEIFSNLFSKKAKTNPLMIISPYFHGCNQVLFHDFNFGVKYRYVLPLNNTSKKPTRKQGHYGWIQGEWKKCSAFCGGGLIQQEKPKCLYMHERFVRVVDESECSGAKLPHVISKVCNEQECEKGWFVSAWSNCSTICGLGRKRRSVACRKQNGNGTWSSQPLQECLSVKRPPSIQKCLEKPCNFTWEVSAWSKCYAPCSEVGIMIRNVTCPVLNACNPTEKPSIILLCKSLCKTLKHVRHEEIKNAKKP